MNDQGSRTRCSKSMHLHSVRARLLKSLTNATTGGPTRLFSSRRVRASLIQIRGFHAAISRHQAGSCSSRPSAGKSFRKSPDENQLPDRPADTSASAAPCVPFLE